uniref:Uncharacterized protein n=1 Tax=Triticum urartu TaxID=4572 RepID=A0A8R7TFK8_TRIUA
MLRKHLKRNGHQQPSDDSTYALSLELPKRKMQPYYYPA